MNTDKMIKVIDDLAGPLTCTQKELLAWSGSVKLDGWCYQGFVPTHKNEALAKFQQDMDR